MSPSLTPFAPIPVLFVEAAESTLHQTAQLAGVPCAPVEVGPKEVRLGVGRPRTPAFVVLVALLLRGFFGEGFKSRDPDTHLLPDGSLEDLRLLTADSLDQKGPFALILAGQPLLRERLTEPHHYALAQRITVRVRLRPLTDTDVALFVDKHLRACGAQRSLFEPDAITLLFQHSRGVARLVQSLALGAMLAAASSGKKTVDADSVQQALLDLESS